MDRSFVSMGAKPRQFATPHSATLHNAETLPATKRKFRSRVRFTSVRNLVRSKPFRPNIYSELAWGLDTSGEMPHFSPPRLFMRKTVVGLANPGILCPSDDSRSGSPFRLKASPHSWIPRFHQLKNFNLSVQTSEIGWDKRPHLSSP